MEVSGSAAIVTGAASGLGAATAAALAERGVVGYGIDLPDAVARASGVSDWHLLGADVTDGDEVQGVIAQVAREGHPLRMAVNCAGIAPSAR